MIYRLTDYKTMVLKVLVRQIAERNLSVLDEILQGLSGGAVPEPITRAEPAARLEKGSVKLLDIRSQDEFDLGDIFGAVQAN